MDKEIGKIKKFISSRNLESWLKDEEGEVLYELAKRCTGEGVIVEIGSWKGKSTIWLGKGSKAGKRVKVYAIDPHTGASEHKRRMGEVWTFDEFKKNIKDAGIEKVVEPIVKTSEEASRVFNEPIELLFIDGAHEYEMVKLDFDLWFPRLIDGGHIVFHDTDGRYGPTKFVKETLYKSKILKDIRLVKSATVAKKISRNTAFDRFYNRIKLYKKNILVLAPKYFINFYKRIMGKIKFILK